MAAAVDLVRADPDRPLTMERVAAALGAGPMSLYTHVRSRDELVALAAAEALRGWQAGVPDAAPWDDQLRAWARSLRDHVRDYSSLLLEMTAQGAFQPALLEEVAVLSRILRRAGLDGAAHAEALRWVPQTVLGAVTLELGRPAGLASPAEEAAAIDGSLAALPAEDRDELAAALPWFTSASLADLLDYSLDRVVDGIQAVAGAHPELTERSGPALEARPGSGEADLVSLDDVAPARGDAGEERP